MSTEKQAIQRAGRPRSEEKRNAILLAATSLFLKQGLQGTCMDAAAREAGVSKQTVYSHFSNTDKPFRARIKDKAATYGFEGGEGLRSEPIGARPYSFWSRASWR